MSLNQVKKQIILEAAHQYRIATDRERTVVLSCKVNERRKVELFIREEFNVIECDALENFEGGKTLVFLCDRLPDEFPIYLAEKLWNLMQESDLEKNNDINLNEEGVLTLSTFSKDDSVRLMKHLYAFVGSHVKSIKAKVFDDNSCAFRVKLNSSGNTIDSVIEKFRLKEVLGPK